MIPRQGQKSFVDSHSLIPERQKSLRELKQNLIVPVRKDRLVEVRRGASL